VPGAPPATLDQKRIAHNMAIDAGDRDRARSLRAEIEAELRPLHVVFDDGTELVGAQYKAGARPMLTLFFAAGGPMKGDVQVVVRSKVTRRAFLSTTMPDPLVREVGIPLGLSPQRWRAGFLYADPVPIRKRPGTETFSATFVARSKAPMRASGDGPVEVLSLD
jgi:hypothetical protein